MGEAARHIPDSITAQWSVIPWQLMCGMRNRIVHGYYQVDPEIVWDTCRSDLPPLVVHLRGMLKDAP